MNPSELTKTLKSAAKRLGFEFASATPAISPTGFSRLSEWLDSGYAGEMDYFEQRQTAYQHPQHILHGVVSLLVLGMNYFSEPAAAGRNGTGRIARYAWGDGDYHDSIHRKLKQLKTIALEADETIVARGVVDTAPLLEREFAQLAGIGWQAKNTMVINRELGSWFFLAALLINKPLDYEAPFETSHCGTCTACLDACPTDAFVQPFVLDATQCISYLTIEHRSPIPRNLRSKMGDWVLGCDVCQDVCPWNRKASKSAESQFVPKSDQNPLDLLSLFDLDDDAFRARFRKTPLWRPKRRGILRNAAIALGNRPCLEAIAALTKGLHDVEPLVRGASAWALGRQLEIRARDSLAERGKIESDATVIEEISLAIEFFDATSRRSI